MGFNLFPDVLWWGTLLVPIFLRLSLSVVFISLATDHIRNRKNLLLKIQGSRFAPTLIQIGIIVEVILAILLLIGLYVQLAAILGMLYGLTFLFRFKGTTFLASHTRSFYFLMTVILFTLFFTGAGPFAFDIPL